MRLSKRKVTKKQCDEKINKIIFATKFVLLLRQSHSIAHATLEVTTVLMFQPPKAGISVNLPSNLYSIISDLRLAPHVAEENLVFKAVTWSLEVELSSPHHHHYHQKEE